MSNTATLSVGGKTQFYRRVIQLAGPRTYATVPFRHYGNSRLWAWRDILALFHLSLNVDKKCCCLRAKQWHEIKSTALATELSSSGLREAANSTETWNFPLPLGLIWRVVIVSTRIYKLHDLTNSYHIRYILFDLQKHSIRQTLLLSPFYTWGKGDFHQAGFIGL